MSDRRNLTSGLREVLDEALDRGMTWYAADLVLCLRKLGELSAVPDRIPDHASDADEWWFHNCRGEVGRAWTSL